jgi:hypothetical protein
VPRTSSLDWYDYSDPAHPAVMDLDAWVSSLAPFAQASVLGQIDALMELAAEGKIVIGDDSRLVPIRTNPDIYELKWTLLSKKVRQYHAEPPSHLDSLLKLNIHIKQFVPNDYTATKGLQDAEILQAALRYLVGKPSNWGM